MAEDKSIRPAGGAPRLTRNQALVFAALEEAGGPLSAYAILDQLRDSGLRAPLQIYRALEKLQALGLVHRLESMNAFVACRHPDGHNRHTVAFAICEDCGTVIEFADEKVRRDLRGWAAAHDFDIAQSTIELQGRCGRCSATAAS